MRLPTASASGTRTISPALQRDHLTERAVVHGVDRGDAEPGRQHTVEGRRRAAPLHVAEDRHAGLVAGALLDLRSERVRDAAEPHVAELVDLAGHDRHRALLRHRPLGDDDDRRVATLAVSVADQRTQLLDVERLLGDEDRTSLPPAMPDHVAMCPAWRPMTSHDHHPVVRLGGRVEPVDGVGGDLHRGVEAERELGGREVVVDRLRHADDSDTLAVELVGDAQRVLAADRDERVDSLVGERLLHRFDAAVDLVGVRPRGAEHRAAPRQASPA